MLDNNPSTAQIRSDHGVLYQLHHKAESGAQRCTLPGRICPGWQMLDNNPSTVDHRHGRRAALPAARRRPDLALDRRRRARASAARAGRCSTTTRAPSRSRPAATSSTSCTATAGSGARPARPARASAAPAGRCSTTTRDTVAITAGGNQLYQLHRDGRIWRSTGAAVPAARAAPAGRCSTTTRARRDRRRRQPALSAAPRRSDLALDGRRVQGESCPGWQMLDNNPRTALDQRRRQPALPASHRRSDLALDRRGLSGRELPRLADA